MPRSSAISSWPGPGCSARWVRSQRIQERQQSLAVADRQALERAAGDARLAAVPEDGLFRGARPAVVEQAHLTAHGLQQPQTPERRGPPGAAFLGTVRFPV